MKKLTCLILCAVLLLGMVGVSASAEGTLKVKFADVEAAPGQTVQMAVTLENNPGLTGFSGKLTYDKTGLSYKANSGFSAKTDKGTWDNSGTTLMWYYDGIIWDEDEEEILVYDDSYTGEDFFVLTFTVKEDAEPGKSYEVKVELDPIYDAIVDKDNNKITDYEIVTGHVTIPGEEPELENGFYLIGSRFDWTVDNLTADQKFELNEETGEYVLKTALDEGDKIKVVRVENGAIAEWYGDFDYEVDKGHAGPEKSIFFNPNGNNDWSQFGRFIWINANATATVYGASLTLDGKIGLNFYLTDLPGELLNNSSFVTLDVAGLGEENSQSLKLDIKNAATEEQDGKTLYKFSVKLAPKQMKDAVTLKVFDNAGDPVLLSNNSGEAFWEYAYTVQDYIRKTIDKAEDSNLVALVKAMSDFGSLAQVQFGYGEPEALYNEDAMNAVTQGDLEKYKATITKGKATGATSEGKSNLVLESATVLNIYFTLDEGEEIENFTFKRGSTKVEATQYDGSTYYVQVPNTAAKNLDRYNTLTIYKNGTKVLTEKCSALSYCYRVLDPESGAQVSMQNLAKGLYLYNLAADAYFN